MGFGTFCHSETLCHLPAFDCTYSATFFLLHTLIYINRMHIFCVVHNMKSIVELSNISCQSKYIQIDSFRNDITKKSIFSAAHDSSSNNGKSAGWGRWLILEMHLYSRFPTSGGPQRLLPVRNISCCPRWRLCFLSYQADAELERDPTEWLTRRHLTGYPPCYCVSCSLLIPPHLVFAPFINKVRRSFSRFLFGPRRELILILAACLNLYLISFVMTSCHLTTISKPYAYKRA